jgi:hypothetical protein
VYNQYIKQGDRDMNEDTRKMLIKLVYSYTSFPISKMYWMSDKGEITTLIVKGGRKTYSIKYNQGTDLFEGFNSKFDKTELYIEQLAGYIETAK